MSLMNDPTSLSAGDGLGDFSEQNVYIYVCMNKMYIYMYICMYVCMYNTLDFIYIKIIF